MVSWVYLTWGRAHYSMPWWGLKLHRLLIFPFAQLVRLFYTYFGWLGSRCYVVVAEPNVGLVNVPDTRLDKLGVINKSVKVVPAVVRSYIH